ncbi:hypothetical protein EDB86DRAFT_3065252 [Lactarius hatsudake]|nr:hypothetical protein EDB86DRAFT_3065252 [Lactarius hatsudake]
MLSLTAASSTHGPFKLNEWIRLMIRWIVTDDQIGEFTLDNASNCDTTMEALEELLCAAGIPFCWHGNCIRVHICRCWKSSQHHEGLQKHIATGNDTNAWDCETCWSLMFNMIDQLIELYPPEYKVLHHIHQMLKIPHKCQELLAAEKTPTLLLTLLAYETLVLLWKQLAEEILELSHYIGLGIAKIASILGTLLCLALSSFLLILIPLFHL